MAEGTKVKLADRSHPLYQDNEALWTLYLNSVKGGKNFMTTTNLFTHRLEDAEDYDERIKRSYFLNYCDSVPEMYNTYIFKGEITRPPDVNLEPFREDVDGRGTNISDFIARVGYLASVFGTMHVLVDLPVEVKKKARITKAEERKGGIRPYATPIYPSQLKDWSIDANGNLRWILIESEYYDDMDPTLERKTITLYKLITTEEWRIEDAEGNPYTFADGRPNKGSNDKGIIPLISLHHKDVDGDMVGESLLKDIVYTNRIIFNWCSCIDEQIERQTFSQLVFPDDGTLAEAAESGDPLLKIATSSILTFPSDSGQPPQFISPNTNTISVIWELVVDHVKEIFRMAKLIGTSEDMFVSKSGRAAQFGFMGVNSALASKAKSYEKFENDVCKMAYIIAGKNESEYQLAKYPASFDVQALQDEIDTVFKILERNFSVRLNKELEKNVSRKALSTATDTIKIEIESEIEASDGIVEPLKGGQVGPNPIDDGSGNPNSNLGKTFKTKGTQEEEETQKQKKEE